jgi:menaquinone-dependent protoporphyrinogen IX oxidase
MVTSASFTQRWLHRVVSGMRGRYNTCLSQKKDGSFAPKINYKSQATAQKSAEKLTEKFGKPFDAYQCWYCKGWHIGGAANLTFLKFLSITLIWVLGKKRQGNKHRLKAYRRIKEVECQRCYAKTFATILSMFNTEEICMDCKDAEEGRSDYDDAVKADQAAVRNGDINFKGIGL